MDVGEQEVKPFLEQLLTPDRLSLLAWMVLLQRLQRVLKMVPNQTSRRAKKYLKTKDGEVYS